MKYFSRENGNPEQLLPLPSIGKSNYDKSSTSEIDTFFNDAFPKLSRPLLQYYRDPVPLLQQIGIPRNLLSKSLRNKILPILKFRIYFLVLVYCQMKKKNRKNS